MIIPVTTWLAYTLMLGSVALSAIWSRRDTKWRGRAVVAFMISALLAMPAALLPMGRCAPWRATPGEYGIVGYKIDEQSRSIYVLIDEGSGPPRCFTMPFTTSNANALQDAAEGGGGKGMKLKVGGGEGGEEYDGPPPVQNGDEHKLIETPQFQAQ